MLMLDEYVQNIIHFSIYKALFRVVYSACYNLMYRSPTGDQVVDSTRGWVATFDN